MRILIYRASLDRNANANASLKSRGEGRAFRSRTRWSLPRLWQSSSEYFVKLLENVTRWWSNVATSSRLASLYLSPSVPFWRPFEILRTSLERSKRSVCSRFFLKVNWIFDRNGTREDSFGYSCTRLVSPKAERKVLDKLNDHSAMFVQRERCTRRCDTAVRYGT